MGDKNKKIEQKSELSIDQDTKVSFGKDDGSTTAKIFFYDNDRNRADKKTDKVLNVAAERIYLLGHHVDNLGTEVPSLADVEVKINEKEGTITFNRKLTKDERNSIEAALHGLNDNEIEDLQRSMNLRNGVKINQLEEQLINKLNEIYPGVDYGKVSAAIRETGIFKDNSFRGYENQERIINAMTKELEENPNSTGHGLAGNTKKAFEAALVAARQVVVGEVSPVKAGTLPVNEKEATLAKALTEDAIKAASELVKTNVSTPAAAVDNSTPVVTTSTKSAPREKSFTEILGDFTSGNSGRLQRGAGFSNDKQEQKLVESMQTALTFLDYHVGIKGADHKFGGDTEAALIAFQKDHNI